MKTRTRRFTMSFRSQFVLAELAHVHPAGDHVLEVDEESIDCMPKLTWRHVATFLHIPRVARMQNSVEVVRVDPIGLDLALLKDCGPGIKMPTRH